MEAQRFQKLKELALCVRSEVQKHCRCEGYADPDDLCGACAVASLLLSRALKRAGFEAVFVSGSETLATWASHCWVEVDGEYTVDVTATQFHEHEDEPVVVQEIGNEPTGIYAKFTHDLVKGRDAVLSLSEWDSLDDPRKYKKWINRVARRLVVT